MNSQIQEFWELNRMYTPLRDQLMESLTDDDSYLTSVDKLKTWYKQLDEELESALEAVSDEDVANKQMDRDGYMAPVHISLDILREALLIFYGKVSVYAKAMGKPLTQTWQDWIA